MVSRRALLGAGALLLVGCGPPEKTEVDAAEVWGEQFRASERALAAYADDDELRDAAARRAVLVGALLKQAGGTFGDPASGGSESALVAEQAALRAHVAAVGLLVDRASREQLAGLIAEVAAAEAALLARVDQPTVSFPGQPPDPR